MNERIQKLAIGCAIQLDWDFPSDPKEYTFSSAGVEKFAELIVKECEKVSLKNSHRNDDMGAIIARQISKHFGVNDES